MHLLFVVVLSDKSITQRKFNRQKFLQTKISQSMLADVFFHKVSSCGHGTGDTVAMARYKNGLELSAAV